MYRYEVRIFIFKINHARLFISNFCRANMFFFKNCKTPLLLRIKELFPYFHILVDNTSL